MSGPPDDADQERRRRLTRERTRRWRERQRAGTRIYRIEVDEATQAALPIPDAFADSDRAIVAALRRAIARGLRQS